MGHEHRWPSTYARIVELLSDGEWHYEPELLRVSTFPEHWVTELAREGHEVKKTEQGSRLVRLATAADV
jgi:hypothetical protein